MEALACLMRTHSTAKELPDEEEFLISSLHKLPMDPSCEDSIVLIWFAKPIPYAQLYHKEASAPNELRKVR